MQQVNAQEILNECKLSPFHWIIFILCLLIIAVDGFDTGIIGFIGSSIADDWHIERSALGPVFSAALVGMVVGALLAGPTADRFGRKFVVILSVFFLGFFTLVSAYSTSLGQLELFRFLTGLGLGAAMPNVATLLSEFMPVRLRALMVNLMFFAFPGGIALGGWASSYMLPLYSWKTILIVGGAFPLILVLILIFLLPESVHYMTLKNKNPVKIKKILERLSGQNFDNIHKFTIQENFIENSKDENSVKLIFSKNYRRNTLLMWVTCFTSLLVFYLLTSWLTIFLQNTGFTREQALKIAPFFPLGGAIGSIIIGWAMDKYHASKTVMICYALAVVCLILTGLSYNHSILFAALILITGVLIAGAQGALPVLTTILYPAKGRATGVSWMHGIGRFGAIFGAMMGGALLKLDLSMPVIFALLAIPIVITALCLFLLQMNKNQLTTA